MTARSAEAEHVDTPSAVGVIGGGQLARMMQQAAVGLGLELHVLCADIEQGAGPVTPGAFTGDPDDGEDVRALAHRSDVITLDHELVDLSLLREVIESGTPVRPGPDSLIAAVDKAELRRLLAGTDVEFADHVIVEPGVTQEIPVWPNGAVVKATTGGYDGRGVWFPADRTELDQLIMQLASEGRTAIVEERISEPYEVAVMAARRPNGDVVAYEPVRTFQEDGICVGLEGPADLGPDLAERVKHLATDITDELDVIGICAVELFIDDGRPLVSEIAARPHNSGHHTIEACRTSQFENHLRAVCDLPLGDPSFIVPGVGLANILGGPQPPDPHRVLAEALEIDPSAKVHLYGKQPRPGRKLGHVTVIDANTASARARATRVAQHLAGTSREGIAE